MCPHFRGRPLLLLHRRRPTGQILERRPAPRRAGWGTACPEQQVRPAGWPEPAGPTEEPVRARTLEEPPTPPAALGTPGGSPGGSPEGSPGGSPGGSPPE